jgi:hypothetical protein
MSGRIYILIGQRGPVGEECSARALAAGRSEGALELFWSSLEKAEDGQGRLCATECFASHYIVSVPVYDLVAGDAKDESVIEEWVREAYVLEIYEENEAFCARLVDPTGQGADQEAEFPADFLDAADWEVLEVGSVLDWRLRRYANGRVSQLVRLRGPGATVRKKDE